tara:strand:+ start:119 stop:340 length:222 start_codon:yes stop_codon:yes gene_type:complete
MRFIGGEQLKYNKAIKDGKVIDKNKDNLITMPTNTALSFGEMTENKGKYSIVMTVVKDFGRGNVSKAVILNLV